LPILYQHPDFDGYLIGGPAHSAASGSRVQIIASGTQPALAGTEWNAPPSLSAIAQYPPMPANRSHESDCSDGEVWEYFPDQLKDRRDWVHQNDRAEAANSPNSPMAKPSSIPNPESSVIQTISAAAPAQKPLKKPGLKKSVALMLCLLPLALSAGFFGWRYSHHRETKPEELLPAVRTPLSQNYLQQRQ
jgi:hypothetical protein